MTEFIAAGMNHHLIIKLAMKQLANVYSRLIECFALPPSMYVSCKTDYLGLQKIKMVFRAHFMTTLFVTGVNSLI